MPKNKQPTPIPETEPAPRKSKRRKLAKRAVQAAKKTARKTKKTGKKKTGKKQTGKKRAYKKRKSAASRAKSATKRSAAGPAGVAAISHLTSRVEAGIAKAQRRLAAMRRELRSLARAVG